MMQRNTDLGPGVPPAFRLGLATRGNTHLEPDDVLLALERGINYWNWCGRDDGMAEAIRQLGPRRSQCIVATQLSTPDWSRDSMWRAVEDALNTLGTDWLDVATLYYVESESEWSQITGPSGALRALEEARRQQLIRRIGLTTHQRQLAARWIQTGLLEMLMIRYNAAHRGAEDDIFPITNRCRLPVVCFTCLRWGALLEGTRQDPHGFSIPPAPQWYRFVLSNPSVSVALMAPNDRHELLQNLALLADWTAISVSQREELAAHGDRVRTAAGPFP